MRTTGHDTSATSSTSGYGRGMLLLAVANAAYIVTAYAVTTITARLLEPADFGTFGVVMAWITVLTALLVKGLSTVTAREMSSAGVDPSTAWHAARGLGIRLSIALAVAGIALSPLAARLVGSVEFADEFAVGAIAALTFGINAVMLAWPTGLRRYGMQAVAQVSYAVARVLLVVGGAWAAGLSGAVIGYVLAPLLAAVPLVARRPAPRADTAELRARMWRSVLPVSVVSIAVTAYFVVDVFALSAVVGGGDPQVGIYVAYGTVAHVPFFLLQAASVTIVPALAAARDAAGRADAIRRTMTDTLVLLAGPTLLLAAAGDAASRVVFGGAYDADAAIVLPLALATAAVTIIANLVAIDVAIGRLRTALSITLAGAALLAVAAWYGADRIDGEPASIVAWAALGSCTVTMLALAVQVRTRHGALLDGGRAARGIVLAVVASIPAVLVQDDLGRLVTAALCGMAWLALVLRIGLVDVRRSAPPVDTLEDPHAPGGPVGPSA